MAGPMNNPAVITTATPATAGGSFRIVTGAPLEEGMRALRLLHVNQQLHPGMNGTIDLGVAGLVKGNRRGGAGGLAVKIEFHAGSGGEDIVGYFIVILETDCVPYLDDDFGLREVAVLLSDLMVCRQQRERAQNGKRDRRKGTEDDSIDHW